MTHFFQPLDLTVNGEAKLFMKDMFTTWYSAEVQKQVGLGNSTDEIEVDLRQSMLKDMAPGW